MDSTGAPRNGIGAPESESSSYRSAWEKMDFTAEGVRILSKPYASNGLLKLALHLLKQTKM